MINYILYRAHGASDELLYVGATTSPAARLQQHSHSAKWWKGVSKITLEHLDDLDQLLDAEADAIRREEPEHNVIYAKPAVWAMKPRRTKGDGSLFKRADGQWIGSVEAIPGPDGKRRQRRVSSKSREGALQKLQDLQAQIEAEKAERHAEAIRRIRERNS